MLQFSVIRTGCVLRGHFGDSLLPGGDGARRCRRGGGGRSKGLKTCWSSCSVPGSLLLWPEEGLWPPPWATTSFGHRSWSGREAAPLPVYPSATPGVSGACRPPSLGPPRAPCPSSSLGCWAVGGARVPKSSQRTGCSSFYTSVPGKSLLSHPAAFSLPTCFLGSSCRAG